NEVLLFNFASEGWDLLYSYDYTTATLGANRPPPPSASGLEQIGSQRRGRVIVRIEQVPALRRKIEEEDLVPPVVRAARSAQVISPIAHMTHLASIAKFIPAHGQIVGIK